MSGLIPGQVAPGQQAAVTSNDATDTPGWNTESGLPELTLLRDLPGFPGLRTFVLVALDHDGSMFELRSLHDENARFMVAAPAAFFPDYAFDVDDVTCAELGLSENGDALVLVVMTLGQDLASSTANLLAPIVINARTRQATQIILQGESWPVRAALPQLT